MIELLQANEKHTNSVDIVYLKGIRCDCKIGVWDWEKQLNQTLVIDLELGTDISIAAADDDLNKALDYQAVAERVQAFAKDNQFELIETMAERIAAMVLDEFKPSWLRLKLDKGAAVKGVKQVGICIERSA